MKKITKIFGMLVAVATLLVSCSKEDKPQNEIISNNDAKVNITINAFGNNNSSSNNTKTYIDGTSVKWSSTGEKLKVVESADGTLYSKTSSEGSTSDAGSTMSFNVSFDAHTASNFTYYAFYPNSASTGSTITDVTQANITTPSKQTPPSTTTFDPSADLLIAKPISNGSTQATSLNMQFTRAVAVGKMTIKNLPTDENVNKITFSANNGSAVKLAGRTLFNINTAVPSTSYGDALAENSIELNTSALGCSAETSSGMDVFFTCYPFELETGNTFTVEVETDTYTCTRTITIPAARSLVFEAGKASRFTVDMTSATKEKGQCWSLYTGAITAGQYLIVYDNKAMKAGVSSNRLQYSEVTISRDEIYSNKSELVWQLAASSTYWTLYNALQEKYAASTGTKNQAQLLEDGSDDKSLWSVSGTETYEFTNKYNNANSINALLRGNGASGFACYGSGTGGTLSLYKKDDRIQLSTPASVSAALNGSDSKVIDVTFSSVTNAGSYVIVATPASGPSVLKSGVLSSPATIAVSDGLSYSTTYTISVYAVPSDQVTYRKSDLKTASGTVTTGSTPYLTTYTTSTDVSVSSGGVDYKVKIGGVDYDAVKANKAATFTIVCPTNTSTIHLFIAAWNGEGCTVSVTGGTMSSTSITADTGISGSGKTYTLAGTISGYYRTITPATSSTTSVTIALPSNKRAVVWGVNCE